jgi:hypothetical protein
MKRGGSAGFILQLSSFIVAKRDSIEAKRANLLNTVKGKPTFACRVCLILRHALFGAFGACGYGTVW